MGLFTVLYIHLHRVSLYTMHSVTKDKVHMALWWIYECSYQHERVSDPDCSLFRKTSKLGMSRDLLYYTVHVCTRSRVYTDRCVDQGWKEEGLGGVLEDTIRGKRRKDKRWGWEGEGGGLVRIRRVKCQDAEAFYVYVCTYKCACGDALQCFQYAQQTGQFPP